MNKKQKETLKGCLNHINYLEVDVIPAYRPYKEWEEKYIQCMTVISAIRSDLKECLEREEEE